MKMKKTKILGLVLALIMFFTNLPFGMGIVHAEAGIKIDDTSFPDKKFRDYVSKEFDTDKNGELSQEEIDKVETIVIRYEGLSSLDGIKYFTKLSFLGCEGNNITKLDLSNNTKLKTLYCAGNQLTELDLKNNKNLGLLSFSDNRISTIDLSNNENLGSLSFDNNKFEEIDLSKNTELVELSCRSNQLTRLDTSNNRKLKTFSCYNNKIKELDLSQNLALEQIDCNVNQITKLDLSKNLALERLYLDTNQVKDLDLSNNVNLDSLDFSNNLISKIDISKNKKLTSLGCINNKLTSLDISNNSELYNLDCSENQFTSLDVSKNLKLNSLECNKNLIKNIDVSKNISLETLKCNENQLTALDLSKNENLEKLECNENQLTGLDVSKNTKLSNLECAYNQITALDLSKNEQLTSIKCIYNQIKELKLNKDVEYYSIECGTNKLTSLDLPANREVSYFSCDNQSYYIKIDKNDRKFDLSTLPGNFDVLKVVSINGANLSGNEITIAENTNKVTFDYKINNHHTMPVTLNIIYNEDIIILPNQENPEKVLDGYVRITFDATDEGYIGYYHKKYIDVKNGTKWGYDELKKLFPADPQPNDSGKEFVKWDLSIPNDMDEVTAKTFTAIYKDKTFVLENLDDIWISKGPAKDEYVEGEKLDLSGLIATLVDNNGAKQDIGFEDFEANKIETDPKNGTKLKFEDNEKFLNITITLPNNTKKTITTYYSLKVAKDTTKKEFDATKLDSITIKTPANKMTYTDGESLDLKGLVVTLKDTEGKTKGVELKDFDKYQITTNPKNGTPLTEANNGTKVTITMGEKSVETEALTVNPKAKPPVGPNNPQDPQNPQKPNDPDPQVKEYWIIRFLSDNPYRGYIGREDTLRIEKNKGYRFEDIARLAPEAIPYSGYEFAGWSPYLYGNDDIITRDMDIYARFEEIYVPRYSYERRRPRRIDDDRDDRDDKKEEKPVEVNEYDKLEAILFINDTMMQKSVNGVVSQVRMDIAPFIYQARTMLPIRYVAEALGFMVTWDANTRTVYLVDKENIVQIPVDTNNIIVNGKAFVSDVKPMIKNNRTMLPVANVARALGLQDGKDILWDAAMKFVTLRRNVLK